MDALGTAAAVRSGSTSARTEVEAALARIGERDGPVNAITVTMADSACAAADATDARVAAGGALPPLLGVPVTVKDHLWLAGTPSTNGSYAYEHFVPDQTCVAVQRLLDAGAIPVAKTTNPEFCYRGYTSSRLLGVTRNPHDLSRTCGGSSGGAAVSLATDMVPLAMGTDGGGSIRIPSAFCGVAGHKPTFGLVPKEPGFRGWKSLSVNGPMARTVTDLAAALQVIAGPCAADDLTWPVPAPDYLAATGRGIAHLRVAWSTDLGVGAVAPGVRRALRRAVDLLARETGCRMIEAHPDTADPAPLWNTIALAEGWSSEGPLLNRWGEQMSPEIADIVTAGRELTAGAYVDALHERAAFSRTWADFWTEHDVLIAPAMPVTAFGIDESHPDAIDGHPVDPFFDDWCALALPANLTGMPATTVPMGVGDDGLPVALQVLAPRFGDAAALAVAAAWDRLG